MTTATFDTHRFYQKFKNDGFTENQANDLIEFVSEAIAAKNADAFTRPEQPIFKSEMKSDFAALDNKINLVEARLETKIEAGNSAIMKYLFTGFIAVIGLLITILLKH